MDQDWDDGQQAGEGSAAPARAGGAGAQMKAAREAMGYSVEQLADQLKLAPRQVIALENEDFAALPPPAVVRGFIRAYAKAVKLDAAPLMTAVPMDMPASESASPMRTAKPAAMPGARFPSHGKKKSAAPLLAAGAIVVLGVAAAAAWQAGLLNGMESPVTAEQTAAPVIPTVQEPVQTIQPNVPLISVPPPAGQTDTGATAPATMPEMAANPAAPAANAATPANVPAAGAQPNAPATGAAANVPTAAPATAPTAAPAPAPKAPATAVAPAAGANTLVVNVKAESWVEVRPVGGAKAITSRLAKPGDTITVEVTGPVQLIVGNPEGVSATLRGNAVSLPPLPGKTVSRVNLK